MNSLSHTSGDTIVALSTPRGYSGVAVIRVSGPEAIQAAAGIFHPAGPAEGFPDRKAVYGRVIDPETGTTMDDGLLTAMRAPNSFTGEDLVELSLIDLVQAEAVMDVIEATSPAAAREAGGRLDASVSGEIGRVSGLLKDLLAAMEAHIDFDEEDEYSAPDPIPELTLILRSMQGLARESQSAAVRRQGLSAVIVGKPNVGKSTLFNALLGSDRVIVTPYPGTTRDLVDEIVLMGDLSLLLCDTAGIREDPEPVEREGIRRTVERMEGAQLVIAVFDGSTPPDDEDLNVMKMCAGKETIIVANKVDLGLDRYWSQEQAPDLPGPRVIVGAESGRNLDALETLLGSFVTRMSEPEPGKSQGGLNSRCLILLEAALLPIEDLLAGSESNAAIEAEIVSMEIRRALRPLEEITGESIDDGVLDRIFERFCVGK